MKNKKNYSRRFIAGAYYHVYQRTVKRGILFYSEIDFLVCVSILSTMAERYHITIISACFMLDHIHLLIFAESKADLSNFMRDFTSIYAKQFNNSIGRSGAVFEKRFGSAPKRSDKDVRSCISYVFNNPVEKKLCVYAEEWKWNFLQFTDEIIGLLRGKRNYSSAFNNGVDLLRTYRKHGWHLNYALIRTIFACIKEEEKESMINFIIRLYLPIDFNTLLEFYDSKTSMLISIHNTTGKEFDIKETFEPFSDRAFLRMMNIVSNMNAFNDIKEIILLSDSDKLKMSWIFSSEARATKRQVSKFLHINEELI